MAKLTKKQEMFVKEYIIDLNGTQAAIRAGYSKKTAKVIANENLTKPYILEAIQKELEPKMNRIEITAERVLEEIAKIAFFNIKNLYKDDGNLKEISELDDYVASAISSIKVTQKTGDMKVSLNPEEPALQHIDEQVKEIKLWDKRASLELLGKYLKLFGDKQEITINNNIESPYKELTIEELKKLAE